MVIRKKLFVVVLYIFFLFLSCDKNPFSPDGFLHPSEGKIELKSTTGYYKDDIFYDSTGDTIEINVKISKVSKVNKAELFLKDPKGIIAQYTCWTKDREADTILWKTPIVFNCSGGVFAELVMSLDDGTIKKYLQTIAIRPKPLKVINLTVDSIKIKPAFSDTIYKYSAEVNCNIEKICITSYYLGSSCNIILVVSNNYNIDTIFPEVKKELKLRYGLNVFEIISKPKNDTNKISYFLEVFRRGGKLDSLLVTSNNSNTWNEEDSIMLSPSFHRDSMKYELKLPYDDSVVTIKAKEMYDSDLIFINNEEIKEKTFTFPGGVSKVVIKVISHDKKDSVEYKIFVERKKSEEARLKGIVFSPHGMLAPEFNPDIKEYTLIIPDSVYELTVVPLTMHSKAQVEIDNSNNFVNIISFNSNIDTVINIKVISESQSKEERYKISIKRSSPDIALIENLLLSSGELIPIFHRDSLNYEIKVSGATDSIKVKPIRAVLNSEVKIDSSIILPDSFSALIYVDYGRKTKFTITVTSQSGNFFRKYNFTVSRPYILNVNTNDSLAGTVEPIGVYEIFADSTIFLKALPKEGYRFVKWNIESNDVENVDIEDETSPFTKLELKSNASIIAEFEAIPSQEEETE